MSPQTVVVASSFTATPLEARLEQSLRGLGSRCKVGFALYSQLPQYLLAPETFIQDENVVASVVLVRIEDWLRNRIPTGKDPAATKELVRQELKEGINEF